MEENKQILMFEQPKTTDNTEKVARSRKEGGVKDETNLITIKLDKGVTIKLVNNIEITFPDIIELKYIVDLDRHNSSIIHSFHPPLYKDFIDSKGQINTIVEIGNIVKVKSKYLDSKGELLREVTDLYFKSLNNMTVIIAVLNDNDFYVANRLEVCK